MPPRATCLPARLDAGFVIPRLPFMSFPGLTGESMDLRVKPEDDMGLEDDIAGTGSDAVPEADMRERQKP